MRSAMRSSLRVMGLRLASAPWVVQTRFRQRCPRSLPVRCSSTRPTSARVIARRDLRRGGREPFASCEGLLEAVLPCGPGQQLADHVCGAEHARITKRPGALDTPQRDKNSRCAVIASTSQQRSWCIDLEHLSGSRTGQHSSSCESPARCALCDGLDASAPMLRSE